MRQKSFKIYRDFHNITYEQKLERRTVVREYIILYSFKLFETAQIFFIHFIFILHPWNRLGTTSNARERKQGFGSCKQNV